MNFRHHPQVSLLLTFKCQPCKYSCLTSAYVQSVCLLAGHYYLVDSGFPCSNGYLPPYRGERYHLQDFRSGGDPRGFKELFNYRHSSLRMVIERCFGVLKKRFYVLNGMPRYKLCRQSLIVNACCTLHNFIREVDRNDMFFEHAPPVDLGNNVDYPSQYDFSDEAALAMANTRDHIAQLMWDNI
jgi:hypothetical protein